MNGDKADMNVRGLDPILYREFKSAVYKAGYNNIKKCMEDMMAKFIAKTNSSSDSYNPNGVG